MRAVETAKDVRKTEISEQPLADPIAFERRERTVSRRDLGAVVEFKPADPQRLSRDAAQPFEPHEALLQEQRRRVLAVVVRRVVRSAETELALWRWFDRRGRQVHHKRHLELELPVVARLRLCEPEAYLRSLMHVVAVGTVAEPVPRIRAAPDRGADDDVIAERDWRRRRQGLRHEGRDAGDLEQQYQHHKPERTQPLRAERKATDTQRS